MLYVDTKKPGRIVRFSHRVAGNRRDGVTGAGWETLFVAIDDRVRIAFTAMHPDVKGPSSFRVESNSQNRCSSSSPVGMWAGCI